tara:strand:- start:453 stop:827 length:375 start_codon:yes stop_codon:yes gene_type:complete
MKIAVYGTLKEGFSNHTYLENATFIRTDVLKGYRMFDKLWYPCVVEDNDVSKEIVVEIYEVDRKTLGEVDRVEGFMEEHPDESLFVRTADCSLGEMVWVYLFNKSVDGMEEISDGIWRHRRFVV